MTDRELMQMALDKLEVLEDYDPNRDNLVKALRERLSQPEPYNQTELELCDVCGWKTVVPDEGCLNCNRLSQPEPEPVGYAGVIIWVGEHRISRLLTKTEIEHERVVGMSITETAQRCLDLLSEAKEKNGG